MKVGKPKSKRVPVRLRHKIEKSSANKQRKQRKEAKKNPQWRSRLKKDPGIPNLFPYKDKVLAEIEESKRRKEEEKQRRIEVARAQREGRKVEVAPGAVAKDAGGDEELPDPEDSNDELQSDNEDEMAVDTNPLAALLASAQARAQTYQAEDDEDDEGESDEPDTIGHNNLNSTSSKTTSAPTRRTLPAEALKDPIKAVKALIDRLQKTQEGMHQLLNYYTLPPLATAGSDTTTRFLVDVARKRGRLGRGGVPNLNSAALTVLGDLNEERLKLPALAEAGIQTAKVGDKGAVQIVTQLAQPFSIEGLFGPQRQSEGTRAGEEMEVES